MAPTLDWTCSRCRSRATWTLVKVDEDGDGEAPRHLIDGATLDFTCSRCGASETWTLVKAGAPATSEATS